MASRQRAPGVKNPVILVHGFADSEYAWDVMGPFLKGEGWTGVHALTLRDGIGTRGLEHHSEQIERFISRVVPDGQPYDLVGYSAGGLAARHLVQRRPRGASAQRLVTLGSPHRGTWMAFLLPTLACEQMRPDSSFLAGLNADPSELARIDFASIWSPIDALIVPAESSDLGVGESIRVCAPNHFGLARDPRIIRLVASLLATSPCL